MLAVAAIGTAIAFALTPRDDAAEQHRALVDAASDASPTPDATIGIAVADASRRSGSDSGATPSPSHARRRSNPFPELTPVDPEEPGEAEGIEASLVKFESVTGEVVGPGDVAAAAVRVTVEITNTGTEPARPRTSSS